MKKVVKRIVGVIMLLTLLFCNACAMVKGYKILKNDECCEIREISNDYDKKNTISQNEFEIAMNNFKNSDGEYLDDYGGCFIDDDGIYNICVTSSNKPSNTKYLKFKRVENSYQTLINIRDKVKSYMDECSIWQVGICEKCNKVNISLEDKGDVNFIVNKLEHDNLFKRNTLQFYISKNLIKPN